jgi:N-acetylmuramoyl-L-alanine amidase
VIRRAHALAALVLALALVAGACSGGGETESAEPPLDEPTTTTSSTVPETTTTTEPPTTTTEPPTTTTQAPQSLAAGPQPEAVLSPAGVVVPVVGREGDALLVGTPCGRTAPLRTGTPVDGAVVLDAGHGGVEPGAVGPGGLEERHLNLAVTRATQAVLEANGVPVVLTRNGDYRITLEARAKIVEAVKPQAFVSIHFNAEPDGPRPEGPGAETYYQTRGSAAAESKRLSGLIYEEVVKALAAAYPGTAWVADRDAGAKYRTSSRGDDYYGIIRRTQGTPGVLAELGFISNPAEEELYRRADVQQVAGQAVANGILRFLRTPDPGSGFVEPYPRETPAGGGGGADNCQDPAL